MEIRIFTRVALAMLLLVLAVASFAQLNQKRIISYQGKLEQSGSPVPDGSYPMTVTLYIDVNGKEAIWSDVFTVNVHDCIFNILLGESYPLPDSKLLDQDIWLGVKLGNLEELRPLSKLTGVPYAINVADKSITKEKLDDEVLRMLQSNSKQDPQSIMHTFDEIGSGTNTSQTLTVGNGSSLVFSGTGIVDANQYNGSGTITVADGGTGATTFTANGVLLGAGAGAVTSTIAGGANEVLRIPGGGGAPSFGQVDLGSSAAVTGTLPISRGGTGGTTPWFLGGNALTSSANWFGSTSGGAFTDVIIKTNSTQAIKYQASSTSTPNIIGGGANTITPTSVFGSVIAGGGITTSPNIINSSLSFIGAGLANKINSSCEKSVIGGGFSNIINSNDGSEYGALSIIGGGGSNKIGNGGANSGHKSAILGGWSNQIYTDYSFAGGGEANVVYENSSHSAIVGGELNTINGLHNFIGGGKAQHIGIVDGPENDPLYVDESVIAGGDNNNIISNNGFIGGGERNDIALNSDHSTVGGGFGNNIFGQNNFIGGGFDNQISARSGSPAAQDYSTIGGGYFNTLESDFGVIVGGDSNSIRSSANYSNIVGGLENEVRVDASYSTIVGGTLNYTENPKSFIGGGYGNEINKWSENSNGYEFIGGGVLNRIGSLGFDFTDGSFIGGGFGNYIWQGIRSVITGGSSNQIYSSLSVVGGGYDSKIGSALSGEDIGAYATIPGGYKNKTNLACQIAMGYNSKLRGTFPATINDAESAGLPVVPKTIVDYDTPLLMIGNGGSVGDRNAFEVSYNGHSIVADKNGAGNGASARGSIRGATYQDNIIYAWGSITSVGGISSDFGVTSVTHAANSGVYAITLNIKENDVAGSAINLTNSSVVVTGTSNLCNRQFYVSPVTAGNTFTVFVKKLVNTIHEGDFLCEPVDAPFTFIVTGRPN